MEKDGPTSYSSLKRNLLDGSSLCEVLELFTRKNSKGVTQYQPNLRPHGHKLVNRIAMQLENLAYFIQQNA